MSFLSKLFGRDKAAQENKTGGIEDFMTLIRVYFESCIAAQVGITNLAALPDLRVFKQTLKVPTLNNKLGLGEKKRCAQILSEVYHVSDTMTKDIDASVKKRCRRMQDVQPYMVQLQGFTQELMMLTGNLMQWKLRLPGFMQKALRQMTEKTVRDILTKNDWRDDNSRRAAAQVRRYQQALGFSDDWVVEYAQTLVGLAKKEKRANIDDKE